MGETDTGITGNDQPITLREEDKDWLVKQLDHLDIGIHELWQAVSDQHDLLVAMDVKLTSIYDELEAARPMIEKWQHSKIRRLAAGQMPWQQ